MGLPQIGINSLVSLSARREAQRLRVKHLYRVSLQATRDWIVKPESWYEQATRLRERFEANKHIADLETIDRLIFEGEAEYSRRRHPEPYVVSWAPGGSKYARNPPVPQEIEIVMDYDKENWNTH